MDVEEQLEAFFEGEGYEEIQKVEGWGWCGLNKYIFTWGVLYGMNHWGIQGRFCFDTRGNALAFYKDMIKYGRDVEKPVVGQDGCTAIK